ncbi:MAG: glycosyltransferase [Xanthobacteraceae bacterium]|nr:glycosyltransferase [Xanthobacteraceae bacterium]
MTTNKRQELSEFDRFYKSFEDQFRGSRALIKARLTDYLPFLVPFRELAAPARAIDLGCGRGEWLELLRDLGFDAYGVDINEAMLAEAEHAGLRVKQEDALSALRDLPAASQSIVSGFHIAEHISFDDLLTLAREAMRVLIPGGLLILETPNPENIRVATTTFYFDPTHRNPLPAELLAFVARYAGFGREKILRLREDPGLRSDRPIGLAGLMDGMSRDYGLVAQKPADASIDASKWDDAFAAEYGLSFQQVVDRLDRQIAADHADRDSRIAVLSEAVERFNRQSVADNVDRDHRTALLSEAVEQERKALLDLDAISSRQLARLSEALVSANEALIKSNEAQLKSSEVLVETNEALIKSNEALRSTNTGLADELAQKDQALAGQLSEIERLHHHINYMNSQRQGMAAVVADLQFQVELLKRSTSWRVTAPLRWIRRAVNGLFAREGAPPPGAAEPVLIEDGSVEDEPRSVQFAYRRLISYRTARNQPEAEGADRPRLAYFSPMPPQRSGIADYSAELLPSLSAHYAIDVIVENVREIEPLDDASWIVRDLDWFRKHAHRYDRILYHLGNSSFHAYMLPIMELYPGVVVLHDFYLGHLLPVLENNGWGPYWTKALLYSHGYGAVVERFAADKARNASFDYPANCFLLECAQGVIVHSEHARRLARKFYDPAFSAQWAVIPSLRQLPERFERDAVRRSLGLKETDFVICSFGALGETKLNHRLVSAFLGSSLADDGSCHLVFVGECPDAPYCFQLRRDIAGATGRAKIEITGYASRELYEKYLRAADVAVQLREQSRGETSAAVRDCMGFGLPVIVNAHGAMAELPEGAVVRLAENFRDADLVRAIEHLRIDPGARLRLGEAAREFVKEVCSPTVVAQSYFAAIERFTADAPALFNDKALASLARQVPSDDLGDEAWLRSARAIANQRPFPRGMRQLLIDVSVIAQADDKTGIQRVVRSQLLSLLRNPPAHFRVEPVRLVHERGAWQYRYARTYTAGLLALPDFDFGDDAVEVARGDVLLVADFFPAGVIGASKQGLYSDWKARGVNVNFMVYDILPISLPQHFPPGTDEVHGQWIASAAASADRLICISNAVADETRSWLRREQPAVSPDLAISAVHLGADVDASAPTTGLPADAGAVLSAVRSRPSFLMVGTIEPRKGHLQALAAFESLWRRGVDVNLVIVGAEGWKSLPPEQRRTIPRIVRAIRQSPELGRRLFWLEGISDEYLAKAYAESSCLVAASEDEGFGLPLIEAARHGIPILARDIPVFREVAMDNASYFGGMRSDDLGQVIEEWLVLRSENRHARSEGMPWLTWEESVDRLKSVLLGGDGAAGEIYSNTDTSAPPAARERVQRGEL